MSNFIYFIAVQVGSMGRGGGLFQYLSKINYDKMINNKPMPNIEACSVLQIHRQLIIDSFQIGNIGSVSAEEMILNFMRDMDLFSYK